MDREQPIAISPGDKLPFCHGMERSGAFYSFEAQAGRPAVLLLGGALDRVTLDPWLGALTALQPRLVARRADLVLLVFDNPAHLEQGGRPLPDGLLVVSGSPSFFADLHAPTSHPLVLVIDRAGRLLACLPAIDCEPADLAAAALDVIASLPRAMASEDEMPAPVLLLPHLLDPGLCRTLIAHFDASETYDSGVTGLDAAYRVDHHKKRRRDCLLEPGASLHAQIMGLLGRRCVPEIGKAFQHRVNYIDRLLVARYDDTGGYFRRHRDNVGESVAFRQFALSINLNTGTYDGGQLLFPEYNDRRYGPPVGGGIVFSASLLHEVTPVTRGSRYVLLTFLYDAAAEVRRQALLDARFQRLLSANA